MRSGCFHIPEGFGSAFVDALSSDAARVLIPAFFAALGLLIGVVATKRKNAREDRAATLLALRKARRFMAPRKYYDLVDDLLELKDALTSFETWIADSYFELLQRVTMALWRDSRHSWEEGEDDPFRGSYSTELSAARDQIASEISRLVRSGSLARKIASHSRKVRYEELNAAASLWMPDDNKIINRAKSESLTVDPTGIIRKVRGL